MWGARNIGMASIFGWLLILLVLVLRRPLPIDPYYTETSASSLKKHQSSRERTCWRVKRNNLNEQLIL
jgi:hypothetical protein